ncbi:MAG: hypothetical protein J1E01_08355 [Acetatifactor sp.]|nr:hypothetical protein [Acetatifactor sp.]
MLGKLIKYEWKSTYKVGLLLLLGIVLATLMGFVIFQAPMWKSMYRDSSIDEVAEVLLNVASVFSILIYVLLLVGAVYGIYIFLVVHFYRSMYKSEGYLLHTLPVTKHQILISKILVSTIWVYLITIAVIVSVNLFLLAMMSAISGESIPDIIGSISDIYSDIYILFRSLFSASGFSMNMYWVMILLSSILGIPAGLIIMFGAISIGQLFSKNRVAMAILSYIGITIARSVLSSLIQGVNFIGTALSGPEQFVGYINSSMVLSLVLNVLLAVGCYIISYHVISRKLNME